MQGKKIFLAVAIIIVFSMFGLMAFNIAKNKKVVSEAPKESDVFTTPESLRAEINAGKKLECTLIRESREIKIDKNDPNSKTYETTRIEATAYFEGNKYKYIRKENLVGIESTATMLFDGETFYRWDDIGDTLGMKVTSECMDKSGGNEASAIPITMEDVIKIEASDSAINCKETEEPIHLSTPSGKTLLDPCNPPKKNAPEGSLKWKLDVGKKMKCTLDSKGSKLAVYLEGEKYKSTTSSNAGTTIDIFDGETLYSWNPATKKAAKVTLSCMRDAARGLHTGGYEFNYMDEMLGKMANAKCEEITSDIDFVIPSGIDFVDQCAVVSKVMDKLKNN